MNTALRSLFIFTAVVLLLGCDRADQKDLQYDVSGFYSNNDSIGFSDAIIKDHKAIRKELLIELSDYIRSKSQNDLISTDQIAHKLDWLVGIYTSQSDVCDISIKYKRYLKYDETQAEMQLELDSLLSSLDYIVDRISISELDSCLKRIDDLALRLDDKYSWARSIYQRGKVHYNHCHYDSAISSFKECLRICKQVDYFDLMINCELLLAQIYGYFQGDYLKSEISYQNVNEYSQKTGHEEFHKFVLLGRAHNYLQLYQNEKSIYFARISLNECEKSNDSIRKGYSLHYISEAYINKSSFDSALFYQKQAVQLRKDLAKSDRRLLAEYGYSLSTLALIYQMLGNDILTERSYLSADSIFTLSKDSAGIVHNNIRYGLYCLEKKKYRKARQLLITALEHSISHENIIFSIYGLSLCDYFQNALNKALEKLQACINILELNNQRVMVPEASAGLLSDKLDIYNLLSEIYLTYYSIGNDRSYLDSALQYIEISRCRSLIELLQDKDSQIGQEDEDQLLEKISNIYKATIFNDIDPETASNQLLQLEDSLTLLHLKNSEEYHKEYNVDIHCIDELQSKYIDDKTLILEYMLSEFGSYVFAIDKNSLDVFKIDSQYKRLHNEISAYIDFIRTYPSSESVLDSVKTAGLSISNELIPSQILSRKKYKRIIVVPSGILYYLPFEALIDRNNQYLAESYTVSYAPSLNTLSLLFNNDNADSNSAIIAIGAVPPLKLSKKSEKMVPSSSSALDLEAYTMIPELNSLSGSIHELDTIASLFGRNHVTLFEDSLATESNLKNADLASAKYIHFSAHGFTNDINPQRSAIILSPNDEYNDGLLQPNEIAELDIRAEFVFLSACRSGSGKFYPGEGVMNLARPFFRAGARAAIVTCWNIDDLSSVDVVGSFYTHLSEGATPSAAMAQAKRDMILSDRPLYHHPYFWAPYIIIGACK